MNIVDRTPQTDGITHNLNGFSILSRYGSTRSMGDIDSVVIHQTGFDRGNDVTRYDTVIAHFVILRDGQVIKLRELDAFLNNAHSRKSVSIEFVGDYPDIQGNAGDQIPTYDQIQEGRGLIKQLNRDNGVNYIFAHRQFNPTNKSNCPGPHIWCNTGYWAITNLGMSSTITSEGDIHPLWEDQRFVIERSGVDAVLEEWESWLRRTSRSIDVKLHNGGVIGVYETQDDAMEEKETGNEWHQPWGWECWLARTSQAIRVKMHDGGIIGVYKTQAQAESEAEPGTVNVWNRLS